MQRCSSGEQIYLEIWNIDSFNIGELLSLETSGLTVEKILLADIGKYYRSSVNRIFAKESRKSLISADSGDTEVALNSINEKA